MARYELRVKPSVAKDLRGIPKADVRRLLGRIEALRDDPRAPGCEVLVGAEELYRVRQGVYRIVYAIHDEQVTVAVVRVGHRGDVYRGRRSRRALKSQEPSTVCGGACARAEPAAADTSVPDVDRRAPRFARTDSGAASSAR